MPRALLSLAVLALILAASTAPSVHRRTWALAGQDAATCADTACVEAARARGAAAYHVRWHDSLGWIGEATDGRSYWHVYQGNRFWPWAGLRVWKS